MKYAWINAYDKTFALIDMCAILDVSVGGYRAWKRGGTPGRKRLTDAQTLAVIRAIHVELKGADGKPMDMAYFISLFDQHLNELIKNKSWK